MSLLLTVLAALARSAPLAPSADEARRAAERELAQQVYRRAEPGLLQRLVDALLDALDRVSGPSGGPVLQLVVVVLVVVAVLVVVLLLVRRTGVTGLRTTTGGSPGLLTGPATADQLRRAARASAQEGRWDDAVLDGFRAVVRSLQDRDLVPSTPGLTASEAARSAAVPLPALEQRLTAAARLFDGVLYGDRRAGGDDAAAVAALDADVASTRPTTPAGSRP